MNAEIEIEKNLLLKNPSIRLLKSFLHGYGVFSYRTIKKNEVIEVSPVIRLGLRYNFLIDKVVLDHIYSLAIDNDEESIKYGNRTYLGLGYLSMYNHQEDANAKAVPEFDRGYITIIAKRDIEPNEEIFITYGEFHFKTKKIFSNLNQEVLKKLEQIEMNYQ